MKWFAAVLLLTVSVAARSEQPAPSPQANDGDAGALWVPHRGVAAGHIDERSIDSKLYPRARKVWVYTPPGYSPDARPAYDVLLCFDGDDYLHDISAPTILDNLLAQGKIPPLVALLVDDSIDRLGDLANHEQFATFLATEVLPWARQNWNITTDPKRTIVAGYSAGGLAAAYVAFKHPELFGNVFSQSGAFWRGNEGESTPYEWLTQQYATAPRKDLRFYVEVGAEETAKAVRVGPVFRDANRRLRDVLRKMGYPVSYTEVPGARHEPGHWRGQFGNGVLYLTSGWSRPRAGHAE